MIRILLLLPVLVLIIDFALSNQGPVQLTLWPTGVTTELPLSVAILGIGALCFVAGAAVTWGGRIAATARARLAERNLAQVQAKPAPAPAVSGTLPRGNTGLLPSRMAGTSVAVR